MIFRSLENPFSHLTAKERAEPSFPVRHLVSKGLVRGRVLDFGSGRGADVSYLRGQGVEAEAFDPHYAPSLPSGRYDTILCTYVLNVLLPVEQAHVLMAISELLNPSGCAFVTVRRDIEKSGYRIHAIHQEKVYQCNVILPYQSVLQTRHCEIYLYRHMNQLSLEGGGCEFCHPARHLQLVTESATAYAAYAPSPATLGHALIIPKSHVAQYFDLSERNKMACWLMVERVKNILEPLYKPEGFTIRVDLDAAGSHAISHTHMHLIPLYEPIPSR